MITATKLMDKDESLVTYDSPMEYRPGVEKHLRDDVFGLLEEIRKHLGNNGNLW
jgi:hypothetical protein